MDPTPEIDERDDEAPAGLSKDAADVVAILEWARRRGFRIPQLEIGAVRMQVTDLRPRYGVTALNDPADIYDEHMRGADTE